MKHSRALPSVMKRSYIFPDDICMNICAFIHSRGSKPLFTTSQANATLKSLSDTTRAWCYASRSIQYENIYVRTAVHLAKLLLLLLKSPNYLGTHIRGLAIGKVLDSHIDVSTWSTRFVDLRVFETLLPHLRGIKMQRISCLQPPHDEVFRSFDNVALPQESRLTALTVEARFFRNTSEAGVFFNTLRNLRQLRLQGVWPSFVRALPTYLPPSVKALHLEEYSLWELESSSCHPTIPPPPPMNHISLEHFYYRDLTLHAARELNSVLVAFASGALVKIAFVRTQYPCSQFDLGDFQVKRRIVEAADRIHFIPPFSPIC